MATKTDRVAKKKKSARAKKAAERSHVETDMAAALVMARREGWLAACREPEEGGGVKGCAQMVREGSCRNCEGVAARRFPLKKAR